LGETEWHTVTIETTVTGNRYGNSDDNGATDNQSPNDNKLIISSDAEITNGSAFGGRSILSAATNNRVILNGNSMVTKDVYGGQSGNGAANYNRVILNGGSVGGSVYGGRSEGSTTNYNRVILNGQSAVTGNISGGYSDYSAATNNHVILNGNSMVTGNVYGGRSNGGTVTNNRVILNGGSVGGSVYGGYCYNNNCPDADIFTDNTLFVMTAGATIGTGSAGDLRNFQYLNFVLSDSVTSGSTLLSVAGTASFVDPNGKNPNSTVNINIKGSLSPLKADDEIILIQAGALQGKPENDNQIVTGWHGVTLNYPFLVYADEENNRLIAKVASNSDGPAGGDGDSPAGSDGDGSSLVPETKSLSEGYLSTTVFLAQSSDFLATQGVAAAQNEVRTTLQDTGGNGASTFAVLGGGKVRYQTGSHVDVKGTHLIAGIAGGRRLDDGGDAMLGAFFEYGQGDYDTYNAFASGIVKGKGDTHYQGVGFLGRIDFANAFHLEGSLRSGKADADYHTNDLHETASYDTQSRYRGAHVGFGKTWALNGKNRADTYVKALWTRQNSDSVTLSTGEPVEFDRIHSRRLRFGMRVEHAFSPSLTGYAGLAYDREYDGKAKATVYGQAITPPDMKGGTRVIEIGLKGTPVKGKPFSLDFGIQGYAGKREGITGSLKMTYFF
jgi:hypothetical protein